MLRAYYNRHRGNDQPNYRAKRIKRRILTVAKWLLIILSALTLGLIMKGTENEH